MSTIRRSIPLALATVLAVLPSSTQAQARGVHYKSSTTMEYAGTLGTMMGAFGAEDPTESETWMQEGMMRTDDGRSSTVTNLLDGTYLVIDHEERTWFRTSFAEMMDFANQMSADVAGDMAANPPSDAPARAGAPDASDEAGSEEPRVEADFTFDADRTGDRRSFGEWEAERVILTMNVEFTAEDDEGGMQDAGDMVMVTELWISEDFPSASALMADALAEGDVAWLGAMDERDTSGMDQIMAANPQVGTAMERMQEEMEGLDGTTLESTAYVVVVAPGQELDRDAVLAMTGQPLSEGMGTVAGRAAGNAARDAAADAARNAAGRLGGLFGRKKEEPEEPELPAQSILSRITTRVIDIEEGPFEPAIFEVDPTYTEIPAPWGTGG